MDLRSLNIEQETTEKKYSPKFLLKSYESYFQKLQLHFHLEPGERKAYTKLFGAMLVENDELQEAFNMADVLNEYVRLSNQHLSDIQNGRKPRKQERLDVLYDEINKKTDYLLNYKSNNETLREVLKAWWHIKKKRLVRRTVLASAWFNFLTKAFSFLLARAIALGIKDELVSLLAIKSGKIWADIIASLLIFLFIDNQVEKIKNHFLWERIKFLHERLLDLDSYLTMHAPEVQSKL
jgi:hypothetical protein